ncbi:MAG: DedA family protein [Acidimicrobiales bacterium]
MPRAATATMIDLNVLAELGVFAYLLIFGVAALDVVFPVLPSEATVILAGVLAWQGRLTIVAVGIAAAAGAIAGDHLSYGLGRWTSRGGPRRSGSKVARWPGRRSSSRSGDRRSCWWPASCPEGAPPAHS